MTFYINVPLSEDGIVEMMEPIQSLEGRARATEVVYGDAAYLLGKAQEQWSDLNWRIEHARTGRFVVKGEPKARKL